LPETCTEVEITILRSGVHLVGFIRKRLSRDAGQQNIESIKNIKYIHVTTLKSLKGFSKFG